MSEEVTQPDAVQTPEPVGEEVQPEVLPEPKSFDEAYVKKLRDEAASNRVKLKEYEDRDKSEAQKQAEAIAEMQRENAELRAGKMRAEIAANKGVPAALLAGSTQEEIEASADALIAFKGTPVAAVQQAGIVAAIGQQPEVRNVSLNDQIAAAEAAKDYRLAASLKAQKLGSV